MVLARLALRPEMLHPDLRASAFENFAEGRYDTANFEAFKCLEVAVRDAAGIRKKLGAVDLRTDRSQTRKRMKRTVGACKSSLWVRSVPSGTRQRLPPPAAGTQHRLSKG